MKFSCGGCGATWTGLAMAHCAVCHITTSNVRNYDAHISARFEHLDPVTVGLVQNARGTWLMDGERDLSELHKEKT